MNKIHLINQAVNQKVRDKNHPFLMTGQSIVEWVRHALLDDKIGTDEEKLYNFVPWMKSVQMLDRIMTPEKEAFAAESKLSNVVTFGMAAVSIFEKPITSNPHHEQEKKLPMFNYYLGNLLSDEVTAHSNTLEVKPIAIVIDIADVSYSHDDLDNWKQPAFEIANDHKSIKSKSSHYLYLGYLYLIALAWEKDFNVYLLENLSLGQSVALIFDFIKQQYSGFLIKTVTDNAKHQGTK